MRIACVDNTATDRAKLQNLIDSFYEQCRSEIGHITLLHTYPASKDEILINSSPDVVVIGPGLSTEMAFTTCRDIRNTFPNLPILLFFSSSNFSLRSLKRFQRICSEVFSFDDPPIRVIHKLFSFEANKITNPTNGSLILVSGVKGGVGATTLVSGLAHAAQSLGKSAIVVDLSQSSALVQYMAPDRWQSIDFAAALTDGFSPDRNFVERCITVAQNGVHLLLPPAGGANIRELWLRNANRFEITLTIIETLKEMYNVVLVDIANSEGILPFALTTRAHANILVSSNDPASVHLLHNKLTQKSSNNGPSQVHILINQIQEKGLTKDDILDFLQENDNFEPSMAALAPLKYDIHGKNWIGTGNTFYTEGSATIQHLLEDTLSTTLLSTSEIENKLKNNSKDLFLGLKQNSRNNISAINKIKNSLLFFPFLREKKSIINTKNDLKQIEPDRPSLEPLSIESNNFFHLEPVSSALTGEYNNEEISLIGKPLLNSKIEEIESVKVINEK